MLLLDFFSYLIDMFLFSLVLPFFKLVTSGNDRYFVLYLLSGLALVWTFRSKMVLKEGVWGTLVNKKVWTSRSAINDYFMLFINSFIALTLFLFVTNHLSVLTEWIVSFFRSLGVTGEASDGAIYLTTIGLTATLFIVKDFVYFYIHYLAHKVPVIWEFHKVHHSAEVLNFTTSERSHPAETLLFVIGGTLSVSIVTGLFMSFFGDSLTALTVVGANIFAFSANIIGGALRHSPFPLPYPKAVEKWLVSPAMHHIHHSTNEKHFDKNMGRTLSIWDKMYGTRYHSEDNMVLEYGLGGVEHKDYRSLSALYISPFVKAKALFTNQDIEENPTKSTDKAEVTLVKNIAVSSAYIGLLAIMVYVGLSLPDMRAKSEKISLDTIKQQQNVPLSRTLKKAVQLDLSNKIPSVFLEDLTFAEVQYLLNTGTKSVIIPTGGTEQNGPHMILGKHNYIVKHTAAQIAAKAGNMLVAPVMAYVPEGDIKNRTGHMAFAGTISLPEVVFENVLENTVLSLEKHGFKTIYLLGDSGGNQNAQNRVAMKLTKAFKEKGVKVVHLGGYYHDNKQKQTLRGLGIKDKAIGSHAGIQDSSELLFVHPQGVRTKTLSNLKAFGTVWSTTGYTGQPDQATQELGRKMIALKVKAALEQIVREKAKS